jgi:perosamine synthetase
VQSIKKRLLAKKSQNKKNAVILSYQSYLTRVSKEKIPCYEPSVGKEELELLTKVINRNWLSESKYTRAFENKLAKICRRKYAVCFSNATSALIAGMKSLGLKKGDEVIVPSFSHSADPNSICAAGATPIFADIDENTLCLSSQTIAAVKTSKTKAILFVSAYGNVGQLDELGRYAKRNNLFLINDCAPALFGFFKNKPVTAYGDFSVLSFFADKTITTGEGGMLLSDHSELIKEANIYKHDGRKERGVDNIELRGYNCRITELQSAVGIAQLKKADYFVKRKKEILKIYTEKLSKTAEVKVFQFNPLADFVPHRIIIFVPKAAGLIDYLNSCGIGVRTLFRPMHSQPAYHIKKGFPATQKVFETGVCLPSAPTLSEQDIEFVCDRIKNFYK